MGTLVSGPTWGAELSNKALLNNTIRVGLMVICLEQVPSTCLYIGEAQSGSGASAHCLIRFYSSENTGPALLMTRSGAFSINAAPRPLLLNTRVFGTSSCVG